MQDALLVHAGPGPHPAPGTAGVRLRLLAMTSAVLWTIVSNRTLFGAARADGLEYQRIAAAAPGFPDELVGSAYTARFVPHFLVGLLADAPGVGLDDAYRAGLCVLVVGLLLVVDRLLAPLPRVAYVLTVWLLVPSPYFLRPYLTDPSGLQDLLFVLGTALALLGMVRLRPGLLLGGLLLSVLGRQSALVTAAVVAALLLADPARRASSVRAARLTAAAAVLLVLGAFAAVKAAATSFTVDFEPHVPQDTVLYRLDDLPGAAAELGTHGVRTFVPVIAVLAVLAVTTLLRRGHRPSSLCLGALLLAAAVFVQPLVVDPAFPGFAYNEQRLAALCLVPAWVAAASYAAPVAPARVRAPVVVLALALAVVLSLHHTFTRVGPGGVAAFLAVQVAAAVGVALLVLFSGRGRPREEGARPGGVAGGEGPRARETG